MASSPQRWQAIWHALGARAVDPTLLGALLARYDEPHRHYHARAHLEACLRHFDTLAAHATHPALVEMALWFHDAIYDIGATDNEARSADWARAALLAAGVDAASAERVHMLVMLTRHDQPPEDDDGRVLLDADLSILGARPEVFEAYEEQIRREFAQVPRDAFRARRRRVLQGFLDRPAIYHTPPFRGEREAQARRNLARSIAQLAD